MGLLNDISTLIECWHCQNTTKMRNICSRIIYHALALLNAIPKCHRTWHWYHWNTGAWISHHLFLRLLLQFPTAVCSLSLHLAPAICRFLCRRYGHSGKLIQAIILNIRLQIRILLHYHVLIFILLRFCLLLQIIINLLIVRLAVPSAAIATRISVIVNRELDLGVITFKREKSRITFRSSPSSCKHWFNFILSICAFLKECVLDY
mmetsp:Transcript_160390/g.295603  ORF Transcript_160390/g.295603 Transcript_160390/m.295603 type:complete len:206 (-) Transcript_160390:187-804(-)